MSFAQAIAQRGINESRELAKLRARTRYHERLDRPKIWPCEKNLIRLFQPNSFGAVEFNRALATLQSTQKTDEYVSAWCKLNGLKL
jgi:hypothetical protein